MSTSQSQLNAKVDIFAATYDAVADPTPSVEVEAGPISFGPDGFTVTV